MGRPHGDRSAATATAVTSVTAQQRVVLSFAYQRHFNSVVRSATLNAFQAARRLLVEEFGAQAGPLPSPGS
jgi:hypothetical protein